MTPGTVTRALSELVLDYDVYPRVRIDPMNVSQMRESLAAGASLPPLVVCSRTLRIADGFHRYTTQMAVFGAQHQVEVIERDYADDGELFTDAVLLNSAHGHQLSAYDRAHIVIRAEELKLTTDVIASALRITSKTVQSLRLNRTALAPSNGDSVAVPLKASIRHMGGRALTPVQQAANRQLSGMPARFHANQLLLLLRSGLIDWTREGTRAALAELAAELNSAAALAA